MVKTIIKPCAIAEIEQATELIAEYTGYSLMGLPHVAVEWDRYKVIEAAGVLTVLGAYLDYKLIGFATLITQVSMHYGVQTTLSESFFVGKAYRNTGAGLKLLAVMEQHAEDVKSEGLIIASPCGLELSAVLPRKGYTPSHTIYFKGLTCPA